MPKYVDGFVLPIPKKNIARYRVLARLAGKVWREKGALEYVECVADDLGAFGTPFQKRVEMKKGETVVFAWIVYKSRAHRDRVNKEVMKDERMRRLAPLMEDERRRIFESGRMSWAGFKVLVKA